MKKHRTIFLGGLIPTITTQDIDSHFKQFGEIKNIIYKKQGSKQKKILMDNQNIYNIGLYQAESIQSITHERRNNDFPYQENSFAYLIYHERSSAEKALANPCHVLKGKRIDCQPAHGGKEKAKEIAWIRATKLYIKGLTHQTTSQDLENHFKKWGQLRQAYVVMCTVTGASKCFGFVQYYDDNNTKNALGEKFHIINGRRIKVGEFIPKQKNVSDKLETNSAKISPKKNDFSANLTNQMQNKANKTYFYDNCSVMSVTRKPSEEIQSDPEFSINSSNFIDNLLSENESDNISIKSKRSITADEIFTYEDGFSFEINFGKKINDDLSLFDAISEHSDRSEKQIECIVDHVLESKAKTSIKNTINSNQKELKQIYNSNNQQKSFEEKYEISERYDDSNFFHNLPSQSPQQNCPVNETLTPYEILQRQSEFPMDLGLEKNDLNLINISPNKNNNGHYRNLLSKSYSDFWKPFEKVNSNFSKNSKNIFKSASHSEKLDKFVAQFL